MATITAGVQLNLSLATSAVGEGVLLANSTLSLSLGQTAEVGADWQVDADTGLSLGRPSLVGFPYSFSTDTLQFTVGRPSSIVGSVVSFFEVTGDWRNYNDPDPDGTDTLPEMEPVSGLIEFRPRIPSGFVAYVEEFEVAPGIFRDTAVAIVPIVARITEGRLCTINADETPGIYLVANDPALGLADQDIDDLYYDVSFTRVTFGGGEQMIRSFAVKAPTDNTPMVLTDPNLTRYAYEPLTRGS